ncbi:MAG TPA: helix-turn-helix domain-containing protein [Hyphomicrobium sp.]|jgi:hypothetical protein
MPKLASIRPVDKSSIRVAWKAGPRAGKRETVDLSPLIHSFKFYKPLRSNAKLFRSVELVDGGEAIAWGDGDIDMAATSIERLAEEAMTSVEFRNFLKARKLTQEAAAALLGRSRRQIANYLKGEKIPRLVALACFGLEAREDAA